MIIFMLMTDVEERLKLETIYHKYKLNMYKIAFNVLKDEHEAQDVVQSSLVKLSQNLNKLHLKNEKKTSGYIYLVTKNQAINVYNRRKKISYYPPEDIEKIDILTTDDVENNLLNYERAKELSAKINKLNEKHAAVITLKYYYEFSAKEISDIMKCTESTVRVMLHRAKINLKKILLESYYEK